LAVAGFATFGLMGLLGLQLDYITATITSFAMGMGSDFAIHLVSSTRKQLKETRDVPKACALAASGPGKVILYNAGCTVLGFSVMVFSRFTALRVFALLICFNMIVILGLTLVIIPAIVERYRPGFFYRYTRFTLNRTEALIGSLVIFGLIAATLATERLF
jgi:predicted RND superfamily exporter protein